MRAICFGMRDHRSWLHKNKPDVSWLHGVLVVFVYRAQRRPTDSHPDAHILHGLASPSTLAQQQQRYSVWQRFPIRFRHKENETWAVPLFLRLHVRDWMRIMRACTTMLL